MPLLGAQKLFGALLQTEGEKKSINIECSKLTLTQKKRYKCCTALPASGPQKKLNILFA